MDEESKLEKNIGEEVLLGDGEEGAPMQELLLFELDGELYAIGVQDVELVIKIPPVTAVPNAPSSIAGIFHHRGRVVVVIDLLRRIGLTRATSLVPYYIFIAEAQKNLFGLLVDRTRTVIRVPQRTILPLDPMTSARVPGRYVKGTFLYQDKITRRSRSSRSDFLIEPISVTEKRLPEPVFTSRPVIILDLQAILDEADLHRSEAGNSPVLSTSSSQQS